MLSLDQIEAPKQISNSVADENESTAPSLAIKARLRSAKRTLRRLSIEKDVVTSRKRTVQTDQPKVCEPTNAPNYYTTYDQSEFPVDGTVSEIVKEEFIVPPSVIDDHEPVIEEASSEQSAPSLLTIVAVRSTSETSAEGPDDSIATTSKASKRPPKAKPRLKHPLKALVTKDTVKRAKAQCPAYKIVEGTSFAVDAFRFGDIDGVKHYFLTHFHADHYIGLKKSFSHTLYLSKMTGLLIRFTCFAFESSDTLDPLE